MYRLLFVIHGMGAGERPANDLDWSAGLIKEIGVRAKRYGRDKDFVTSDPKKDQVLVVPLSYHKYFDGIRKNWKQQSGTESGWMPLLQQLAFSDPATIPKIPGWVQGAGSFFWPHVLDVLLYCFVPTGFTV